MHDAELAPNSKRELIRFKRFDFYSIRPRVENLILRFIKSFPNHSRRNTRLNNVFWCHGFRLVFAYQSPSAALMRQWTGLTLFQVMACRLFDVNQLPEQCWCIVNWTIGNTFQWNLNRHSYIFMKIHVSIQTNITQFHPLIKEFRNKHATVIRHIVWSWQRYLFQKYYSTAILLHINYSIHYNSFRALLPI